MKAKLIKETEKAVQLTFIVEIYGDNFTISNQWFPKSQLEIKSIEGDKIDFVCKNDWILDLKVKEFCKWEKETYSRVRQEKETYLSPINNVIIDYCWI